MDRLFTLDAQFLFDAIVLAISMFVMFTFLSYLCLSRQESCLKQEDSMCWMIRRQRNVKKTKQLLTRKSTKRN